MQIQMLSSTPTWNLFLCDQYIQTLKTSLSPGHLKNSWCLSSLKEWKNLKHITSFQQFKISSCTVKYSDVQSQMETFFLNPCITLGGGGSFHEPSTSKGFPSFVDFKKAEQPGKSYLLQTSPIFSPCHLGSPVDSSLPTIWHWDAARRLAATRWGQTAVSSLECIWNLES